jgi:hypothetical protein
MIPSAPITKKAVASNDVLSNFVDAGEARLLIQILGGPVWIAPSVLDPSEIPPYTRTPKSEFARGLRKAQLYANEPRMVRRVSHRNLFIKGHLAFWQSPELTMEMIVRCSAIRQMGKYIACQDAESLMLAECHQGVLLTDSEPLAKIAQILGVKTYGTCELISIASRAGLLPCSAGAELFNKTMVDELGFHAYRENRRKRLYFRCDTGECKWEPISQN